MNVMRFGFSLTSALFVLLVCTSVSMALAVAKAEEPAAGKHVLWYEQPARNWNEALPVGNGKMGAMVFGGVSSERIQFNEDTLWLGGTARLCTCGRG